MHVVDRDWVPKDAFAAHEVIINYAKERRK